MMITKNINPLKTKPKADLWFAQGERLPFNHRKNSIVQNPAELTNDSVVWVWNRLQNKAAASQDKPWITMMPGFPDGSFGWAATEKYLDLLDEDPRLYVEYVGMGDSDKPQGYNYTMVDRANMIEAIWRHYDIKETVLVTFDFSSIVAMELLSRQIERTEKELQQHTSITKVLLINGGYFADSHSHPIFTTPLLKTSFGKMGAKMAQNSSFAFNMMMKDLWSKEYGITKEELAENHNAIGRREGTVFMSNAAGFVDEHQRNAKRWDLKRIFDATHPYVEYIVAGSEKDQFEPKQFIKAQNELGHLGLQTRKYPGGHMTTSEHPDLIADTIEELKSK